MTTKTIQLTINVPDPGDTLPATVFPGIIYNNAGFLAQGSTDDLAASLGVPASIKVNEVDTVAAVPAPPTQ